MSLSTKLHSLGESAFKHPWRVLSFWVVILGLLGFTATQFLTPPSSNISIPGTPAQAAIDRVEALFPDGGGASGRVVFKTNNGTIGGQKDAIDTLVSQTSTVDGVALAVSPFVDPSFVSEDGTIAYAQVQLKGQVGSIDESTIEKVQELVADTRTSSLQVEIGGDLVSNTPGEIIGSGEVIGVAIALLVLVMTLGSLIAGGMPIISALVSIAVSMAALFSLSRILDINSTTPVLAVMLGLAVGIDYSLFIVNKYRTLVLAGFDNRAAAGRALGTAGNAVVFAAITVIIALSALSIVNIPFMTIMGLTGAASIAIAAIVALTLTPALLGFAGNRVFSKKQRANVPKSNLQPKSSSVVDQTTFWYKWGKFITARPIPIVLLVVVVIGFIAYPAKDLTLGLPTDQYAAESTSERKAYDLLSEGFGAGFNGPLIVVVENLPKVSYADREIVRQQALQQYQQQIAAASQSQTQPTTPAAIAQATAQQQAALAQIEAAATENAKYVQLSSVATKIAKLSDVQKAQPALVTDDGTAGIIQVIPRSAPSDEATKALITTLRSDDTRDAVTQNDAITLAVTGSTALQEDINSKLAAALPVYLLVIVGLSLILLIIAFRSILVPIKATLGFILSVLAMFGAIVAVFQWGWFGIADSVGPIVSFIPIIATGILFGLAMDYEFFLVSGMHEAYQHGEKTRAGAKSAVLDGFGAGSKVVTAAAVIMISVFAGFITNHQAVIQSIGLGLAVGILVDAFLVRMTLVPALMTLFGKAAWWMPKWLDKILPHVSIEGEDETVTKRK